MIDQKVGKADEPFFVVDGNDRPLPSLPRRLVHGRGIWHRVSHVWVVNDRGQFLCQQRSLSKEINPGFWEPFFGGHLSPDEPYAEGAARELREEISLDLSVLSLRLWKIYKFHDPTGYNNEFQGVFIARWNGKISDLTFDDGEVEQVVWKDAVEIEHSIVEHGGNGWTNCGYELDLLAEDY
jgi:8-oxo-dGTP pyrophosphatase MutT (NUDIX family)